MNTQTTCLHDSLFLLLRAWVIYSKPGNKPYNTCLVRALRRILTSVHNALASSGIMCRRSIFFRNALLNRYYRVKPQMQKGVSVLFSFMLIFQVMFCFHERWVSVRSGIFLVAKGNKFDQRFSFISATNNQRIKKIICNVRKQLSRCVFQISYSSNRTRNVQF